MTEVVKLHPWRVFKPHNTSKFKRLAKHRLKTYGISVEGYDILYSKQRGCCACCGIHQTELKRVLAVDHCHNTSKIRGLLCSNCNVAIGLVKENTETLAKMITYLTGKQCSISYLEEITGVSN